MVLTEKWKIDRFLKNKLFEIVWTIFFKRFGKQWLYFTGKNDFLWKYLKNDHMNDFIKQTILLNERNEKSQMCPSLD